MVDIDAIKNNITILSKKIDCLNIDSIFVEHDGKIDKFFYNVDKGNFKYKYKEENILVEYKFIKVNDTYYLDIITNDVKKSEVVYLFALFRNKAGGLGCRFLVCFDLC